MGEAKDCSGRVGQHKTQNDAPKGAESADDDELIAPGRESSFDVAYGIA